jgi:Skp family chaperone for outer membrane proteins
MKIFNLTVALAFSLTLVAGMGSKSKPATTIDEPKVLPESTRASAPQQVPVELIENTAEDNHQVEKDLDKAKAQPNDSAGNKKAAKVTKAKPSTAKKKKAAPTKKSPAKPKKN